MDKPLGFFDLPRELRDMIYDHILDDEIDVRPSTPSRQAAQYTRVRGVPNKNLLLVNHRFKAELETRPRNNTRLTIDCLSRIDIPSLKSTPTSLVRQLQGCPVEINLGLWYNAPIDEPLLVTANQGPLLPLTKLRVDDSALTKLFSVFLGASSLTINLFFDPKHSMLQEEALVIFEFLHKALAWSLNLRDMLDLRVYDLPMDMKIYRRACKWRAAGAAGWLWQYDENKILLMEWCPEDQRLKRV